MILKTNIKYLVYTGCVVRCVPVEVNGRCVTPDVAPRDNHVTDSC